MPETPTPLDLGAIRARSDARRDYADERPESLHDPEHYAALADESAADVPALLAEVERLRAEVDRLRAEVARLAARPARAEVDREALRRFVDSFCDDEAGEVEHVVSVDRTSGFALTGGNDAHAVLCKAASALWPGESRAEGGADRG